MEKQKTSKSKVDFTKIQWTNVTWNPWHGCIKVSSGCRFCYMYRDKERYGQKPNMVLKSKTNFKEPLKWKEPQLVFTCSWSDWFIEQADEWRDEAWEVIKNTPQHTYQILTKRPERIKDCLPKDWGAGYPNVWIGVSVESNLVLHRLTELSKTPAAVRFISAEPLIEDLDLTAYTDLLTNSYDWIIIGGESGNKTGKYLYRPCEMDWITNIIQKGRETGTKVFVKQVGTHLASLNGMKERHGGNINEWPENIQIREFPLDVEGYLANKIA